MTLGITKLSLSKLDKTFFSKIKSKDFQLNSEQHSTVYLRPGPGVVGASDQLRRFVLGLAQTGRHGPGTVIKIVIIAGTSDRCQSPGPWGNTAHGHHRPVIPG